MEHIEPSRVVSVRCADFPHQSGNDIAQIIVRMNTIQVLYLHIEVLDYCLTKPFEFVIIYIVSIAFYKVEKERNLTVEQLNRN